MDIKTLHKELIINDKFVVKVYIDDSCEYSTQSFKIRLDGSLEDLNGYGLSCLRVSDDDSLMSELKIHFQEYSDQSESL